MVSQSCSVCVCMCSQYHCWVVRQALHNQTTADQRQLAAPKAQAVLEPGSPSALGLLIIKEGLLVLHSHSFCGRMWPACVLLVPCQEPGAGEQEQEPCFRVLGFRPMKTEAAEDLLSQLFSRLLSYPSAGASRFLPENPRENPGPGPVLVVKVLGPDSLHSSMDHTLTEKLHTHSLVCRLL